MIDFGRRRKVLDGVDEGQMSDYDRELLYNLVIERKPTELFEVGFMLGGGSTYYITSALAENRHGMLYSSDIDKECFDYVEGVYGGELVELGKHVKFYLGDCLTVFQSIINDLDSIDFVLLDGLNDAHETVSAYNMFVPKLKAGSVIALHDWCAEKCRLIKPILESDNSLTNIVASNDLGLSIWEVD